MPTKVELTKEKLRLARLCVLPFFTPFHPLTVTRHGSAVDATKLILLVGCGLVHRFGDLLRGGVVRYFDLWVGC